MGTKSRKNINLPARRLLAENVRRLRDERYRGIKDKNSALAKHAGTRLSTIQRLLSPDQTGASIDIIANVAAALGVLPCELLLPPGMSLDRGEPPPSGTPTHHSMESQSQPSFNSTGT